jgi:hypothetical protein
MLNLVVRKETARLYKINETGFFFYFFVEKIPKYKNLKEIRPVGAEYFP